MVMVGVTGSFGSGKSLVASFFKKHGAKVIDADKVVHELFQKNATCRRQLRTAFGPEVLTARGVDRQALAKVVFADQAALEELEAIIHPLAWKELLRQVKSTRKERVIVIDAPLLIEAGWHEDMDLIIVVKTAQVQQIERVMKKTGLKKADVLKRIRRQIPLKEKLAYADMVIDNNGPVSHTRDQVKKIWDIIRCKAK